MKYCLAAPEYLLSIDYYGLMSEYIPILDTLELLAARLPDSAIGTEDDKLV